MASEVSICNSALQKLGGSAIVSLTEDSVNARECNRCYVDMRDAELRAHVWNFARKRVTLSADSAEPDSDVFSYQFTLPADYLRVVLPQRTNLDWTIEGGKLLTNDGNSLADFVYVRRVTDANLMDPLFRDSLACRIALQICEKVTQSSSKKEGIRQDRKDALREARRINAMQRYPGEADTDSWETARL